MRLSRTARRNAATVNGPARRATYCRHWGIVSQRCDLHDQCSRAADCMDYEDAQAYHLDRLRREGRLLERTI